jgi:hypothetical protein
MSETPRSSQRLPRFLPNERGLASMTVGVAA